MRSCSSFYVEEILQLPTRPSCKKLSWVILKICCLLTIGKVNPKVLGLQTQAAQVNQIAFSAVCCKWNSFLGLVIPAWVILSHSLITLCGRPFWLICSPLHAQHRIPTNPPKEQLRSQSLIFLYPGRPSLCQNQKQIQSVGQSWNGITPVDQKIKSLPAQSV